MSQTLKDNWLCPSCTCSRPKSDNNSTPVRPSTGLMNQNNLHSCSNVNTSRGSQPHTTRGKINKEDLSSSTDLATLVTEFRKLRQEMSEVKQQNVEIKNQMLSISDHLAQTLKEHSTALENAQTEIITLKSTIGSLQQKLAVREQDSLINSLEITGLPEQENENLLQIVMVSSKKVGVDLAEADVDDVIRVGPKIRKAASNNSHQKTPRPIVVKLLRKQKRDELIKAAKARRNITTENITGGQPTPIFFNERLTKENRLLFRQARLRTSEHGFRYCWIRNGSIYVRKSDGKPAIRISRMSDLDDKVGQAPQPEETAAEV